MDPITHALVGSGVAALDGAAFNFNSPIFWGSILGSIAPDLDILYQVRGHAAYLRYHRGFSHSILGLILLALGITGLLFLIFPKMAIGQVFLWTLCGAISHTFLDILNSYGAQVFKRRITLNLLQIFDPILIIIFLGLFVGRKTPITTAEIIIILSILYFALRFLMRKKIEQRLWTKYGKVKPQKIVVMPAMLGINNWDFVVETKDKYLVGQAKYLDTTIMIRRKLKKHKLNEMIEKALESKLGRYFQKFTPYFYITHIQENGRHVVKFVDLRYYTKKDFLHSATVILNEKCELLESVFHPYSKQTKVRV